MSRPSKTPHTPANHTIQRGWRIDRIPGKPPRRLPDDRFGLPLWLVKDGEHVADLELVMSAVEAEGLHALLCYLLAQTPAPLDAPDCRLTGRQRAVRTGTAG